MIGRRELLKRAWQFSLGGMFFFSGQRTSWSLAESPSNQKLNSAIQKITNNQKLNQGRVALSLPELAVNQKAVPFRISIDSPMTDSDYVKKIHLLASENQPPRIASFYLTPFSGKAVVSSRMRLDKSQNIVAIAEMSDGTFYIGQRKVELAVPGFSNVESRSQ